MSHVTVDSLRSVLVPALGAGELIAGFTPTDVDDKTVKVLQAIVANDEAMALAAQVIDFLAHRFGNAELAGTPVDVVAELKGAMSHVAANVS